MHKSACNIWCYPYDLLLLPVRTSQHGRDVGPVEKIAGYHPGRVILIGRQPASGTTVKVGFWSSSKAIKITPNIAPGVGMYICTYGERRARTSPNMLEFVCRLCVLHRGSNHVPAEWHIDGLRHLREGNQEFLTVASSSLLRIMSSRANYLCIIHGAIGSAISLAGRMPRVYICLGPVQVLFLLYRIVTMRDILGIDPHTWITMSCGVGCTCTCLGRAKQREGIGLPSF